MGLDLDYINGQTPLDVEEKLGLKLETISTSGELNEFEQKNIEEAIQWLFSKNLNTESISQRRLSKSSTNKCMERFSHGQECLESLIKILESINGRFQPN